jgi:CheY-like chemotaxis protein
VLLDLHMPVLDGFETARRIRSGEAANCRCPIIAMTADVLAETRERCFAAGMDDYLAKPFRSDELATILERWVVAAAAPAGEQAAPAEPSLASAASHPEPTIVDPVPLAQLPPELAGQLIVLFREIVPSRLASLDAAMLHQDPAALIDAAHSLKGEAVAVGALELGELCSQIERADPGCALSVVQALLAQLDPAVQRAFTALDGRVACG